MTKARILATTLFLATMSQSAHAESTASATGDTRISTCAAARRHAEEDCAWRGQQGTRIGECDCGPGASGGWECIVAYECSER